MQTKQEIFPTNDENLTIICSVDIVKIVYLASIAAFRACHCSVRIGNATPPKISSAMERVLRTSTWSTKLMVASKGQMCNENASVDMCIFFRES